LLDRVLEHDEDWKRRRHLSPAGKGRHPPHRTVEEEAGEMLEEQAAENEGEEAGEQEPGS